MDVQLFYELTETTLFQVTVCGYSDKLHVLFDKVIEKITNFTFDEKRFHILKENVSRYLFI